MKIYILRGTDGYQYYFSATFYAEPTKEDIGKFAEKLGVKEESVTVFVSMED